MKPTIFLILFTVFGVSDVYGEDNILITYSNSIPDVIIDGRWSFPTEWKASSYDLVMYDDQRIHLRSAHNENFVYIMINFETDTSIDTNSDMATICLDPDSSRPAVPTEDIFCFTSVLGQNKGNVFQGGSDVANTGHFKKITGFNSYETGAMASDENDRYSKIPHSTFEFKIPIDKVGRFDNYGLFLSVYDDTSKKFYTWPADLRHDVRQIPSPQLWGQMLSPDKSLPEFPIPLLALVLFLSCTVLFTRNTGFAK